MRARFTTTAILLLIVLSGCKEVAKQSRSPESDALLRASRAGHADAVRTILSSPGADVNARAETGETPLIEAARFGHDEVVSALLSSGADVKAKDRQGKTALMYASEGGHAETLKLLKQAGALE